MVRIDVDIEGVRRANRKLSPIRNNIDGVVTQIINLQSSIDSRVLNENNLRERISSLRNNIKAIEGDIKIFNNTLESMLRGYEKTDRGPL